MGVKESHELKHLKSKLVRDRENVERTQSALHVARKEAAFADTQYQTTLEKIKVLETMTGEVIVTEHALLRYLERVHGIDLEDIRRRMLTDKAVALIKNFKTGKIPSDDCRLVVKDGTVITVEKNT